MSYSERGPRTHKILITDSLDRISQIGDSTISPLAEKVLYNVNVGEILVKRAPEFSPWLSNFHLLPFTLDSTQTPKGVIEVDRSSNATSNRRDGETVRTLLVAAQYPNDGYDRPLRQVYQQAIEGQKLWLNQTGDKAFLDPRTLPEDVLLRKLMGHDMLFFDFGMGREWSDAILAQGRASGTETDTIVTPNGWGDLIDANGLPWDEDLDPDVLVKRETLDELRGDPIKFFIAREKIWQKYLIDSSADVTELRPVLAARMSEFMKARLGAVRAVKMAVTDAQNS